MSNSFYVCLLSNVSDYPQNQPNKFRVHLPKPLYFTGDWVCGVHSISYPYSWPSTVGTLDEQWIDINFTDNNKMGQVIRIPVPKGSHNTPEELLQFLIATLEHQGAALKASSLEQSDGLVKKPSILARDKREIDPKTPPRIEKDIELPVTPPLTSPTSEKIEESIYPVTPPLSSPISDNETRQIIQNTPSTINQEQTPPKKDPDITNKPNLIKSLTPQRVESQTNKTENKIQTIISPPPSESTSLRTEDRSKPVINSTLTPSPPRPPKIDTYKTTSSSKPEILRAQPEPQKPITPPRVNQDKEKSYTIIPVIPSIENQEIEKPLIKKPVSTQIADHESEKQLVTKPVTPPRVHKELEKPSKPVTPPRLHKELEKPLPTKSITPPRTYLTHPISEPQTLPPRTQKRPQSPLKDQTPPAKQPSNQTNATISQFTQTSPPSSPSVLDAMGLGSDKNISRGDKLFEVLFGKVNKTPYDITFLKQIIDSINLSYHTDFKRFKLVFSHHSIKYLSFSPQLGYVLGFANPQHVQNNEIAKYGCDLRGGFSSFAIYAKGLTENMIVGNSLSSLLRIVSVTGAVPGEYHEKIYDSPIYVRVLPREVNEIEVELRTMDNGRLVPFAYGTVSIVLVFKKVINF
uniref:Uncharacterized protein n=1 Tax=Meloidogyne enterolobii TaxID=390850 RepID=A0A6V7X270_MELEN|nr:unnamed protein product [Meloidogyne enterolobii]